MAASKVAISISAIKDVENHEKTFEDTGFQTLLDQGENGILRTLGLI